MGTPRTPWDALGMPGTPWGRSRGAQDVPDRSRDAQNALGILIIRQMGAQGTSWISWCSEPMHL